MNVFADYKDQIIKCVSNLSLTPPDGSILNFSKVTVEPPRDQSHGHLATNIALILAKQVNQNPRDLAATICNSLTNLPEVEKINVAGPGFINLHLKNLVWQNILAKIINLGSDFGAKSQGNNIKVNVEYVSANPTGPLHVGHCRGAVFGDALASLLKYAGYDVTREYYINDAGVQVKVLYDTAYWRYKEALKLVEPPVPEDLYPGEYMIPVGQKLASDHGNKFVNTDEETWVPTVRKVALDMVLQLIKDDLAQLDIQHDLFFSELSLHTQSNKGLSAIEESIKTLRERNLVYVGHLPKPKGKTPEDWENDEQTLFRATEYSDDMDRTLIKNNGSYTYFAADVAYFHSKFSRGFTDMIYVLGADHAGYIKRLKAIGKAVAGDHATVSVCVCQLVNLIKNGENVKMSKRKGDFELVRDVVNEIGKDPIRFMMLFRKNDAPLDFDFEKVTEKSKENPVFYVQYAHARCASIFREAKSVFPDIEFQNSLLVDSDLDLLVDEGELEVLQKLAIWPRIIEGATEHREPHRIAFYLYELASVFHSQWNKGTDNNSLRFIIQDDLALTTVRLALVKAVSIIINTGLTILGVNSPEEMR